MFTKSVCFFCFIKTWYSKVFSNFLLCDILKIFIHFSRYTLSILKLKSSKLKKINKKPVEVRTLNAICVSSFYMSNLYSYLNLRWCSSWRLSNGSLVLPSLFSVSQCFQFGISYNKVYINMKTCWMITNIFPTYVHPIQGPFATQCRGLLCRVVLA